jgi:hypothetical protein
LIFQFYYSNFLKFQLEQGRGDFWSSGSSDLEAPAWDIEFSGDSAAAFYKSKKKISFVIVF